MPAVALHADRIERGNIVSGKRRSNEKSLLVLPGDGIGPEVTAPAVELARSAAARAGFVLDVREALAGGAAIDATGEPLPAETLAAAHAADAVLLGAVGGPKWDGLPMSQRPERGLLALRSELRLFANLRPALLFAPLAAASSLKPELVTGLDILIVRELTGGIYFGEPRGVKIEAGERVGFNTYIYSEGEIARIARVAFDLARKRSRRVCSVDKANVLEVTQLWRDVVTEVAGDYPDVALSHMYVDNAGMQLVREPKQFDVLVTGNMFGDILSDVAAMLTGSLGMLPSASLAADGRGLYEPVHGSAPDIAGRNVANPLATMLSVAMMFRYSFDEPAVAAAIESAVDRVLASGLRTRDIMPADGAPANHGAAAVRLVTTNQMADAVLQAFANGGGVS
jgi:3-isopropylmalate dehydrogenase